MNHMITSFTLYCSDFEFVWKLDEEQASMDQVVLSKDHTFPFSPDSSRSLP